MDMAAWLWERVERRDAPAVLAHALSVVSTRDALLRQAAITEHWDHLAVAAEEAAQVARHVGWSRSGPDAVAAICRWIFAEKALRRIPPADLAAPLAGAALAAWDAPAELARRIAASGDLSSGDSSAFERALGEEAAWLQSVDDLEERLGAEPEALVNVLEDDEARAILLRHTARTCQWEDLSSLVVDARQTGPAEDSTSRHAVEVAHLSAWMLGQGGQPGRGLRTRADIAEALAGVGRIEAEDGDAAIGHEASPGLHPTPAAPTVHTAPDSAAGR